MAWEASRNGIDPRATTALVNPVSLATIATANIASHRDYMATTCPGDIFHNSLPAIRADVAARITVPKPATTFSPLDFTGDDRSDLLGVTTAGDLYRYRGNGIGGFTGSGVKIGTGWGGFVRLLSLGDFTGDGRSDLLGLTSNGDKYLQCGNGIGGLTGSGAKIGTGWGGFGTMFFRRDFTGDRRSDLLGVTIRGELYLYRGNGAGGFAGSGSRSGRVELSPTLPRPRRQADTGASRPAASSSG